MKRKHDYDPSKTIRIVPEEELVRKPEPVRAEIPEDELVEICRPLISKDAIAVIRDEINAKIDGIRLICQPVAFFCDEALRALSTLDDNQNAYREKLLIEARQRAAQVQETK
jgi:hypothetical protein